MDLARRARGQWRDGLLVAALRVAICVAAIFLGAPAVSDDDFARITIAQQFALTPSFDPSGTSWLPAPFWLQGGLFMVFGRDPLVAQVAHVVLSGLSAWAVLVAARWLGVSRTGAMFAALGSSLLPHVVWFGLATVPSGYTAALSLIAIASVVMGGWARWAGAAALLVATLCRYEAWAFAGLFALRGLWELRRGELARDAAPLLLPLIGPFAWMAHGVAHHDGALFFVDRVVDYRRALGEGADFGLRRVLEYPWIFVRAEPALTALFVGAAWLGRRRLGEFGCPLSCVACLLAFLVVGDLRDGAPTHHPERPLLVGYLVLVVFVAAVFVEELEQRRTLIHAELGLALGLSLLHPLIVRPGAVNRDVELEVGRKLRPELGDGTRALVDTPDYGYFAVAAGLGVPRRIEPLESPDPRDRPATPLNRTAEGLAATAEQRGATHLLMHGSDPSVPHGAERVLEVSGRALFRLPQAR